MRKPDLNDGNQIQDYLKKLENAAGLPLLNLDSRQDISVSIRPSQNVSPGKFKADPLIPGGYLAHPQTMRALKKDIFLAGEDMEDLEDLYICKSCKTEIDLQFWHFCPFCGSSFQSP
jgi:hypothetical protein